MKAKWKFQDMKDFLDEKADLYNRPDFIEADPISIPHAFTKKEDIEIAAFLAATIAWGNRKSIITNANRMMEMMDQAPHDFILHFTASDLKRAKGFVHRTFNEADLRQFLKSLQYVYTQKGGLESVFSQGFQIAPDAASAIIHFRSVFFEKNQEERTLKHVSNPATGSSAKRLNMYLRWMVREDQRGVDFGIWKSIQPAWLSLPLDVHTGNVARKLQLLERTQNDLKAVQEIDHVLRSFHPEDPIRYDFALFGLGAIEKF